MRGLEAYKTRTFASRHTATPRRKNVSKTPVFHLERVKNNAFHNRKAKYYFWRTTQKQEIDFIEELDGKFSAYEFKYNPKKSNVKCPLTFSNAYPEISFSVITKENYTDFITEVR